MRWPQALVVSLALLVSGCAQAGPEAVQPPDSSQPAPASSQAPPATETVAPEPSAPESVAPAPTPTGALANVTVEDQGPGNAPVVTFDTPLAVETRTTALLTPGTGEQVAIAQEVRHRQIIIDADTGETVQENFTAADGMTSVYNDTFRVRFPELANAYANAKVGAFIAVAAPGPNPGEDLAGATLAIYQIESVRALPDEPKLLSHDQTAALAAEGKLPVATFDADGVPSVTIPDTEAPKDLAVQVLTEGTGEAIGGEDQFTALFTGWTWDGDQFDSAFDRGAADTFDFRTADEAWLVGLNGQHVGSTVMLTVPASMQFDFQAGTLARPEGPLVFVITIESKL